MTKFTMIFSLFVLCLTPFAHGAVQMGAGSLKTAQSTTPTPEQNIERDEQRAMDKMVEAKQKLVPLARSVSNIFRPQLTELRDSLVDRALSRLPEDRREAMRPTFEAYIDIDHLQSVYTRTLLDYYTEEELKALRTFLADDVGQRVLAKLPMALSRMHLERQKHLERTLEEIIRKEVLEKAASGEPTLLAP